MKRPDFTEEQIYCLRDLIINKLVFPLWIAKEGLIRPIRDEEFIIAEQSINSVIDFIKDLKNERHIP